MIKIKVNTIGLHTPITAKCNDRILTTQGLSIKELCELWKWYYKIAPFDIIVLQIDNKTNNAINQRTLHGEKSAKELFIENGIRFMEVCDD